MRGLLDSIAANLLGISYVLACRIVNPKAARVHVPQGDLVEESTGTPVTPVTGVRNGLLLRVRTCQLVRYANERRK